ncbi:MAG: SdpI family protein [Tissierellia bacterium]|nr:SdpI family protein [Tissierellia bacterium]MDD4678074.1 SdpI family protein [Tissierellia bacterium]
MMKLKVDKLLIISTVVCLLPIILSLIMYDKMPDRMPIHWDIKGNPDNYGTKAFATIGLPLIMAGLNLITHFALNSDPKRANSSVVLKAIGKLTIPFLTVTLVPITIFAGLGYDLPIEKIVPAFVGILFIIIGNYLPKSKQNYTVGIKLPWTLNNETNWNKTHRLAGYLWIVGGVMMFVNSFLQIFWMPVFIIIMSCLVFIPVIYSYILYRNGY